MRAHAMRISAGAALIITLLTPPAQAWDPLGHGLAAVLAVDLVKDRDWRWLLKSQTRLLFSSAGFPDIPMRKQSTELAGFEAEAPNHYFHIDDPKLVPLLRALRKQGCDAAGKTLAQEFGKDPPGGGKLPSSSNPILNKLRMNSVGVSPWRADQFVKLARQSAARNNPTDIVYYLGLGSHVLADHSVPWHAMTDAHGAASGHANIHIFLEKCADSMAGEELEFKVKALVPKKRKELSKTAAGSAKTASELAIIALEESLSHHGEIEAIDTPDVFISGKLPAAGISKDAHEAARNPEACEKFKPIIIERLATAAAFVSLYYDLAIGNSKAPMAVATLTENAIKAFESRPYLWFDCKLP